MSTVAASSPAWTIPDYLEVREGHLAINGADALDLVRNYGSPLFVFSGPRIKSNIARLKTAAQSVAHPIRFFYASKANSNMAVLKLVLESGIDLEVNSGGELYKALRVGFRPDQIIFNGTSKTDEELDEAVRAGIYSINVDSIYEIELVEAAVRRARSELNSGLPPARIALRLVPEIGTRSHLGLQTALLTSKFGISSSEVLDAFRRGLQHPDLIHVCGIHIHVGSQTPDVEPFAEAFKSMWNHLMTIHRETGLTLEHINLGGGIPVNYLRDRSQAEQLPEHERDMLGAELEPSDVLAEALRVARESARHVGFDIKGATVAVQGFGNVGSVSADLISRLGAKIVAVTDWKGGVYNEKGLDIAKMLDFAPYKLVERAGFPMSFISGYSVAATAI